jgi:hypothetical protein
MHDGRPTSAQRPRTSAGSEGLRFVYAGNKPGQVGDLEDTRAPVAGRPVIGRLGYVITAYALDADGALHPLLDAASRIFPRERAA